MTGQERDYHGRLSTRIVQARDQLDTGAVGGVVPMLPFLVPLQTGETSNALCEAGVGALVTLGLYLVALALLYLAMAAVASGFINSRSKKGDRGQGRNDFRTAGQRTLGAVIVAALPNIANAAGFAGLGCVDSVTVFGAIVVGLP